MSEVVSSRSVSKSQWPPSSICSSPFVDHADVQSRVLPPACYVELSRSMETSKMTQCHVSLAAYTRDNSVT